MQTTDSAMKPISIVYFRTRRRRIIKFMNTEKSGKMDVKIAGRAGLDFKLLDNSP